jgi:hypothetical protein
MRRELVRRLIFSGVQAAAMGALTARLLAGAVPYADVVKWAAAASAAWAAAAAADMVRAALEWRALRRPVRPYVKLGDVR